MNSSEYEIFGYTFKELEDIFKSEYSKGLYHSSALFKHLYKEGSTDVSGLPEYEKSPDLAGRVEKRFPLKLPRLPVIIEDSGTRKFTLQLKDGTLSESVLIPMSRWHTLCVSSQIGCSRGCAFCETARMGLIRNLDPREIVVQWAVSEFRLGVSPRNIVFMGMGEPFDNFDNVIKSIDILSDPRGPGIPKRRISVSTAGHAEGIKRLSELDKKYPDKAYRTIHLAVSLNASNNTLRDKLMPINRIWPMETLKEALINTPQSKNKDALYYEYVLISGVNDSPENAGELVSWLEGLSGKVNLIPYHKRGASDKWDSPDDKTINKFLEIILASGRECRVRRSRGRKIEAACGMLGKESRKAALKTDAM